MVHKCDKVTIILFAKLLHGKRIEKEVVSKSQVTTKQNITKEKENNFQIRL